MIKILDFYGATCPPCHRLKPILEEFENVEFINAREDMRTSEFGVRRVPTVVFLKDEEEVFRFTGFKSKEEIQEILDTL